MSRSYIMNQGSQSGMTLIEVVVATFLVVLMASGIYMGIGQGTALNYTSAQYISALGLGRERLEQMRGVAFTSITTENFPAENVTLTHLGGSKRLPLPCVRSSTIIEQPSPTRKLVKVTIKWNFRHWSLDQSVSGVIFYKDGSAAAITDDHSIGGQININPNNKPDNEFTMTLGDGTVLTRDDLHQDYPGYTGSALLVHVQPKGNGNQNGLVVDGNPYPVANGSNCDITSDSMSTTLYNDNVNPQGKAVGKWWISINASDATISVY